MIAFSFPKSITAPSSPIPLIVDGFSIGKFFVRISIKPNKLLIPIILKELGNKF